MEKRKLGHSDIEVSVVGVGCNNFGRRIHDFAGARAVVDRASISASRCSTPPTSTATAPRRTFLGETIGKRRASTS